MAEAQPGHVQRLQYRVVMARAARAEAARVIIIAPRNPSRAGSASLLVANARNRDRRWPRDFASASRGPGWVSVVICSGGPVGGHPGQFGQPGFGRGVDRCRRQGGLRPLCQFGDPGLRRGQRAHPLDHLAQFVDLGIGQLGADGSA